MKKLLNLTLTLLILNTLYLIPLNAQVGINNDNSDPDPSAMLDVKSTDKGVLIPRMSSTDRQQILDPAIGLMVYDSTAQAFYYFNGMGWLELLSGSVTMLEDADNDTKIQVEESADEDAIRFDVTGKEAMLIDNLGNVGVGVIPKNQLSVKMDLIDTGTVNIATGSFFPSFSSSGTNGWQSFTSTTNGVIDVIKFLGIFGASIPKAIRIYEGEGLGGQLLYEDTNANVLAGDNLDVIVSNDVYLVENQKYTIEMTDKGGWALNVADTYGGGVSDLDISRDYRLRISILLPSDTLLFEVRDTVVQIGEYSLPNMDGAADQVLSTDGNGTVDWQDLQTEFAVIQDSDQDTKIKVEKSTDEDKIRFDVAGKEVMLIDNLGNVGIRTIPNNQLSVEMKTATSIATLTINTNLKTLFPQEEFADPGQAWQSIKATEDGRLERITLNGSFSSSNPTDIRIYEGEGTNGILIHEELDVVFEEFTEPGPSGDVLVTTGDLEVPIDATVQFVQNQQYTIALTESAGWSTRLNSNYAGGISSRDASQDFLLQAFTSTVLEELLFEVRDTVVQIGEYSLPNRDGTTDQVLSTDGNGIVSWRSIVDTDNQTLTFDGANNNLSISNGNTVDLSSIDTDTDDQTLSFNTANNELSIADGNTVDLSGIGSVQSIIADSDNNTKIQVEESANDNLIRFDVNNTEVAQFTKSVNSNFILRPNSDNIFIGRNVGASTTGSGNVFVGEAAGGGSTSAVANVVIGNQAGSSMTDNDSNVFIGSNAGNSNVGDDNVIIGSGAADSNTNGANNVIIGKNTGQVSSGSNNIFLGSGVGRFETGSNKLLIDNEDTPTPLVYGEFDNNVVRINGALEVTGSSNLVPVGTIIMWIGDENETIPDGWLICDNRLYNTTTYPDLFALLDSDRTPNFLGRFPVGAPRDGINGATGIAVGGTGGEEDKTLSVANLPPHSHDIKFREGEEGGGGRDYSDINAETNEKTSTGSTESTGDAVPFKILPPFLGVQFLIKAE